MSNVETHFQIGDMVIDKYEKPPIPRRVKKISIVITVEGGRTGELRYTESRLKKIDDEVTVHDWIHGRGLSMRLLNLLLIPHIRRMPVSWLLSRAKIIQDELDAGRSFRHASIAEGRAAYQEGVQSLASIRGMGEKAYHELADEIAARNSQTTYREIAAAKGDNHV